MRIGGLLLAGGRSRRFGSEKAMATRGSGVMMDAPLLALRKTCLAVAVSVRTGSGADLYAQALGLDRLEDEQEDPEGPLAGIRRGLVWAEGKTFDVLAVAPCDAPTLNTAHYLSLLDAVALGAAGAIGRSDVGLEPLVSIWPVQQGRAIVETALNAGRHPSIRAILESLDATPVALAGYDGLNVNTPDDLAGPSSAP